MYTVASLRRHSGFLAGQYSTDGWWYYFPFAFLVKTPIAHLALLAGGLAIYLRRRQELGLVNEAFVVLPVAIYLPVAMATGFNIGLRHILPVYPFVLMIAAAGAAALLKSPKRRAGRLALATAILVAAVEFSSVFPHTLTFFNQFVGGPDQGYRYLTDSNHDWGQELKALKAWMNEVGVGHVNLAYFGQADPAYYQIRSARLPGEPSLSDDAIQKPELPGYVAISTTVLSGVYLPPHWRLFYAPFQAMAPTAVIGNALRVYWVEQWPEVAQLPSTVGGVEAHRALADTLLFDMQWPEHALHHYREFLEARPGDAGALANLGAALAFTGDDEEAVRTLRRAVERAPRNVRAHELLAELLFARRDTAGALAHAQRAAALDPRNAGAQDMLGRALAVEGRVEEAVANFERALTINPSHAQAREHLNSLTGRHVPLTSGTAAAAN